MQFPLRILESPGPVVGRVPAERVAPPRLVFSETTQACNLSCRHCRAVPQPACSSDDFTTYEGFGLMDQLAALARPVLILAGGEPLYQPDIYELGLRYDPRRASPGAHPLCSIRKRRP